MKLRYIVLITIVFFSLLIFTGINYVNSQFTPVSAKEQQQSFIVAPKETWPVIIDHLKEKNLIKSPFFFKLLLKINGAGTVTSGAYTLSPSMTSQKLIDVLTSGKTNEVWFRINEGYRLTEVVDKVESEKLFSKEAIQAALDPQKYDYPFLAKLPQQNLEGFLYPDTYLVPSSSKPEDFVKQVLKNFGDKIAPFEQDFATNKLSMYQILTIASIVEKEATKQEDRDMIAGVFLKRFEVGMSLGADPTVLYALGSWKADLTVAALNMDSPYNTRKFTGLPPSPICNPSISSIKATLRPTSTDYLYFVAKDGKNYYSKTLEEHEKKKNELGVY